MQQQKNVRRATPDEAGWIVDLSARVQTALSAVGSLQVIGPLPMDRVQSAAEAGYAYLLEVDGRRVGSVLVEPLPDNSPFLDAYQLHALPAPLWFLSKLMLEPGEQSKGFGLNFLAGVKELVTPAAGTIPSFSSRFSLSILRTLLARREEVALFLQLLACKFGRSVSAQRIIRVG